MESVRPKYINRTAIIGPKKYIMSSPILTGPGTYRLEQVDKDKVRQELLENNYTSAIDKFTLISAFNTAIDPEEHIRMNRIYVKMNINDKAIIFKMKKKITDDMRGKELASFIKNNYEVFMLERIE